MANTKCQSPVVLFPMTDLNLVPVWHGYKPFSFEQILKHSLVTSC